MTRKHYNQIADAIYWDVDLNRTYSKSQLAAIVARALRGTNPNYDEARFYKACVEGRKSKRKAA